MSYESLVIDLAWPEGPAVLPDGRVAFVETYRSQVSVWSKEEGYRPLASPGGGPNAVTLGDDDHLYLCQNGGVVGPWRAPEMRSPSIERISLDGAVETVAVEIDGLPFRAPNDLTFGADGRLYFTDPGGSFDLEARPDPGRIFALAEDGTGELIAELGNVYPNGIAAEPDGSIIWVESYTRVVHRWRPDGSGETLATLDEEHIPDGLAVASNGDLYVTSVYSGGIDVVAPDGGVKGFIEVGSVPTNCAFAGNTLYVTDGGSPGESSDSSLGGVLWGVDVEVEGQPIFNGHIDASVTTIEERGNHD